MASARKVEEALADVFQVSLAASKNVLLTAQDQGLIRVGVRGKQLHYNVHELNNLLLAHTIEPRPEMGARVPHWRRTPASLVSRWVGSWADYRMSEGDTRLRGRRIGGSANIALDDYRDTLFPRMDEVGSAPSFLPDPHLFQILPGDEFGEALDGFVDYISRSEGKELRSALDGVDWSLTLSSKGHAIIVLYEEGITLRSVFQPPALSPQPKHTRQDTFSFAAIEVLADLWADTRSQAGSDLPGLPTNKPERKKAAGLPPPNGLPIKPKQTAQRVCETHPAPIGEFSTHTFTDNLGDLASGLSSKILKRRQTDAYSGCSCST